MLELNGHALSRMGLDEVNKLLASLPAGDVRLKILKGQGSEKLPTRASDTLDKLLDKKMEKRREEGSVGSSLSGASGASDELGEYWETRGGEDIRSSLCQWPVINWQVEEGQGGRRGY